MASTHGFRNDNIPTFAPARGRACAGVRRTVKCPRSILSAKQHPSQPGVRPNTMPPPEPEKADRPVVLLTGATGYVGGRLLPLLEQQPVVLRCLARKPDKLRLLVTESTQVVRGDVLDPASLDGALHGVHTAYYLVHLMSDSKDFEKEDKQAA